MPWKDFREFLTAAQKRGCVKVVEGADCNLEIGTLTELMCERGGPMLLFDRIKGYPAGYRIAAKPYSGLQRAALAFNMPEGVPAFDLFKMWREKFRSFQPIPPRTVSSSPVMENVLQGEAVDLLKFPTPKWHEQDGGAYFGTGCSVLTRDPDEEWANAGTYRCVIHDRFTLGFQIAPYHHGNLQMRKWWARGKSCPIAVAITVDPYLFCASTSAVPWGTTEYEYAGFIKGEPEEVFPGPVTGLPLPANAELIVEGEVPPMTVEQKMEGPFGEYTGYYAGGERMRPVIKVKAIYHRTNPILHGDPPLKPGGDRKVLPPAGSLLTVWEGMEKSGIPGIKGVYALNTGGALTTVVSIKQQYAGHARQVGRVASGLMHSMCRVVVVVEDDIDPSNAEEVLWAIATRTDPETSFEIQRDCPSTWLDPMLSPEKKEKGELSASRALIIACRPWEWMKDFPAVSKAGDELRASTFNKWRSLFEGVGQ
jgi:4-hydroxy-3-polyprenylbenzoate decarboxylase